MKYLLVVLFLIVIACHEEKTKCDKARERLIKVTDGLEKATLVLNNAKVGYNGANMLVESLCGAKANPLNCENAKKVLNGAQATLVGAEILLVNSNNMVEIAKNVVDAACIND